MTALADLTTYDGVVKALEAAIAIKGEDFVYSPPNKIKGCVYIDEGRPSCIVAHILVNAGADIDTIADQEGIAASYLFAKLGLHPSMRVTELIDGVQMRQDGGESWGEAFKGAKSDSNF